MRDALFWVVTLSISQIASTESLNPKRGLTYHNPSQWGEYDIFWSENSTVTWYYNWGPYPTSSAPSSGVQFYPLIHGLDDLQRSISMIQSLPRNQPPHNRILSFNEPDGSKVSGGSDISPADAAAAYIKYIVPLRSSYQISHPVTTGSGNGLNWLRNFNASCYQINPATGCPSDFVAAHHYGDFPALASWLGQLHEFYPGKQIYITEFALPQTTMADTLRMMNQSLPYLDQLDYVSGYAWFGMFRTSEANNWTGPGVSLLDANGGLSDLGSLYLGGPERGFAVGKRSVSRAPPPNGPAIGGAQKKELMGMVIAIAVASTLWSSVS